MAEGRFVEQQDGRFTATGARARANFLAHCAFGKLADRWRKFWISPKSSNSWMQALFTQRVALVIDLTEEIQIFSCGHAVVKTMVLS